MRVATRLNLMAAGATCVILIMGITSFVSVENLIKSNKWVSHSKEVLQELNLLLYNLSDTVSTERTYIITGQDIYLDAYQAYIAATNQSMMRVQALVSDNPSQSFKANKLAALIQERLASLAVTTKLYQDEGKEAAFKRVRYGKSLQFRIALHKAIDEMRQYEISLLQERDKEMHHSAASSQLTIVAGACLGLVSTILFSLLFGRYILNCIEKLIKASDNIIYGRFDLSTSTNSNDEFADLATAFNTVGQQLLVVTKKLSQQEKEALSMTKNFEEAKEALKQLTSKLSAVSKQLYQDESALAERQGELAELTETFSGLTEIVAQLDNIAKNSQDLVYRIRRSRDRAEEYATALANENAPTSNLSLIKEREVIRLKEEVAHLQESLNFYENIVSNLSLLSLMSELEDSHTELASTKTTVMMNKLKEVAEEAKRAKVNFQANISKVKFLADTVIDCCKDVLSNVSSKRILAENLQQELARQAELCRNLDDNGIEVAVQNYAKIVNSKKRLSERMGSNIDHSDQFLHKLRELLREPTSKYRPEPMSEPMSEPGSELGSELLSESMVVDGMSAGGSING